MKRLNDDPAVRLAECRGDDTAAFQEALRAATYFDEAAERVKFEKHYASMNDGFCPSSFEGEYDWADCQSCWLTWLACAKSRAEVK